ncbi:amino acid adenylation protein [Streptomyces yokosukanensis]|uniref:Amino acid adenylation protein n=1 Tax=Streptomyces yokosukanensis TaxID=67386 RepID=A0A101PDD7_9ACTN|nr:amino acid adenylation protein [Streptomyces yokosukanensis]
MYRSAPAAVPHTLLDLLERSVAETPDDLALDDGTVTLSYRRLAEEVERIRRVLRAEGIGRGDRVGVRMASGSVPVYLAILGVLAAGAAYVPVDADDPDERAELVWRESGVCAVLSDGYVLRPRPAIVPRGRDGGPGPDDDAWIIFTSGSTGKPKGVAISHRSAAAFVEAEARLFLRRAPIGPGDRVLAGLSVAFDASCEEMWLAWSRGACLVPAPRALVRTGADLGPWLQERKISIVSTVPTLAALWSREMLAAVRLLIVGGEACPPEVVRRFACHGREVWNTYGPTEATVVSCATRLADGEPVRIGLPLDGWELAVVDPGGEPVAWGETGELVIAGVGLGRYLDPVKDAERFTALPSLHWDRAYRSGDLVRADPQGLAFVGRADDQVKIGGRRIELGEVEAALLDLPSVAAAAATVRRTAGGLDVLVGYVVPSDGDPAAFDRADATRRLRERLPAPLVPRLAVLAEFPTRGSGKADRDALPWPLPAEPTPHRAATASAYDAHAGGRAAGGLAGGADRIDPVITWLLGVWSDMLGAAVTREDDFFDLGGTSLAAARLVSALRERFPEVSVSDLYHHPTPAALYAHMVSSAGAPASGTPPRLQGARDGRDAQGGEAARGTPRWTGWAQTALQPLLLCVTGLRWVLCLGLTGNVLAAVGRTSWLPTVSWWLLAPAWLVLLTSPGRVLLAAGGARLLRGRIGPGEHRRGGLAHLRLWTAERWVAAVGLAGVSGTPLAAWYARLLGCTVGKGVDLHALPPTTGLAHIGDGASVEPEADIAGWWIDGDRLRVGAVRIGAGASVGGRVTLQPGAEIGDGAEVRTGSTVSEGTRIPTGACWGGSPARPQASEAHWPPERAARSRAWTLAYTLTPAVRGLLTAVATAPALLTLVAVSGAAGPSWSDRLLWLLPLVLLGTCCEALLILAVIRCAGRALKPGTHPLHSRAGWSAWLTRDLMAMARTALFPLYAGLFTPVWLRLLGARVGKDVESSTVVALPRLLRIDDRAFLADDVLAAPYETRGGWVRLGNSRIGEGAFVGNSAVVGPDRSVADGALIGVLSDTPVTVPEGSSWLGRPAMRLRRVAERHDPARTFAPPPVLRAARGAVELCRVVPLLISSGLQLALTYALLYLWHFYGAGCAVAAAGLLMCGAAAVAGLLTTAAKWALMGRFTAERHPLWSAFVWRNELWDVFVEMLAVPWLVTPATGTPVLNWWLRSMGARIGRGVWCETHWFPEPDLISVGDGAAVNRGCVLQTHLFHDRVMRLEPVDVRSRSVLGPHSILLPGSALQEAARVGAGSLVMAAERVPAAGRWEGTPITRAD